MKRIINTILLLLLVVLGVNAQGQTTTDCMQTNEVVLDVAKKNQTVYLEVSLSGEHIYSAYSVDIVLPQGVSVADYNNAPDIYFDSSFSIYPKSGRDVTHTLSWSDVTKSPLAVACISSQSLNLNAKSGLLFNVGLVLNDDAKVGQYDVKLNAVYLITSDAVKYKGPDTTARFFITNTTAITDVDNPGDTTDAIYSVEGVKVQAPQKGHVYIVDGKKMKF